MPNRLTKTPCFIKSLFLCVSNILFRCSLPLFTQHDMQGMSATPPRQSEQAVEPCCILYLTMPLCVWDRYGIGDTSYSQDTRNNCYGTAKKLACLLLRILDIWCDQDRPCTREMHYLGCSLHTLFITTRMAPRVAPRVANPIDLHNQSQGSPPFFIFWTYFDKRRLSARVYPKTSTNRRVLSDIPWQNRYLLWGFWLFLRRRWGCPAE